MAEVLLADAELITEASAKNQTINREIVEAYKKHMRKNASAADVPIEVFTASDISSKLGTLLQRVQEFNPRTKRMKGVH